MMSEENKGREESRRLQMMGMFRDENHRADSPEQIISRAVEKCYPRIDARQKQAAVHELMTEKAGTKIKIGEEEISIDALSEYVADSIEKINAGSSDYGASSESEYFGWIENGQKVISAMNDGFISNEDLSDKHELLKNFEQREVDLMTCISLYRNCNLADPKVKAKYDELNKKLVKLREIRSAVVTSTRDRSDEKALDESGKARDKALAIVYTGVLTALYREATTGKPAMSDEDKRKLNVYFEPDVSHNYLINSLRSRPMSYFNESLAEQYLEKRGSVRDKESLTRHIMALSGRMTSPQQREAVKPVNQRKQMFDMQRYLMLKNRMENAGAQRV